MEELNIQLLKKILIFSGLSAVYTFLKNLQTVIIFSNLAQRSKNKTFQIIYQNIILSLKWAQRTLKHHIMKNITN
jgi:hypothetical protein